MKNFHRLATGINTGPLMAKIARNESWWTEDRYLCAFRNGPFVDVDSMILRFPERFVAATEQEAQAIMKAPGYDQHECLDMPIYDRMPEARMLVMNLFQYLGGTRLGRVLINRLKPGAKVDRHADTLDHANYWQRHHIVLQSAPGVLFMAGDEQVYMAPGEAWWFDNGKGSSTGARPEHEVLNNSAIDRIHLIMDVRI